MNKTPNPYLNPREEQVMEIIHEKQRATAAQVRKAMPAELSDSAVRTFLRILEKKGRLRHIEEDGKYVYLPTRPRQTAARAALRRVVRSYFGGSVEKVMATLLSEKAGKISSEQFERLQKMVSKAQEEGGGDA
jgi:BlaI family transcriptional regulator, penicillinase repressor